MNKNRRTIFILLTAILAVTLGINIVSAEKVSTNKLSNASVNIYGEKTDVMLGEDILIKLSAVNLITNPEMHVQVIIIPPSGMSVTSSEFTKAGAGQFTTNYRLIPGDGKDIEVRIKSNQVGNFNVSGRIIYYFGNNTKDVEDNILNLPIKVISSTYTIPSKKDGKDVKDRKDVKDIYGKYDKDSGYKGIIFTLSMISIIGYMTYAIFNRIKKHR